MNAELFLTGLLALTVGALFEVLTHISKSKPWLRARVLIILGLAIIAISALVS